MDTSVENIEMCRKAIEIQEWWHNNPHIISEWARSYFISLKDKSLIHYYDFQDYPQHSAEYIWLPTQHQLQNILRLHFDCTHENLRDAFKVFINNKPAEWEIWTNEKLWLAFVMWIKFQKKWNGSDWENE